MLDINHLAFTKLFDLLSQLDLDEDQISELLAQFLEEEAKDYLESTKNL